MAAVRTCARPGCGKRFEPGGGIGRGRPRRFCSDACRQAEHQAIAYQAWTELARRHPEEYEEIRARVAAERAR